MEASARGGRNQEGPVSSRSDRQTNSSADEEQYLRQLPSLIATSSRQPLPTDGFNPAPMRIRRLPSTPSLRRTHSSLAIHKTSPGNASPEPPSRRRSSSEASRRPQDANPQPDLRQIETAASALPTVVEERSTNASDPQTVLAPAPAHTGRLHAASNAARSFVDGSRRSSHSSKNRDKSNDYEAEVVDYLDVVDPEVSTLTTLNNVQNSLFVPYLGRWFSRQPTYDLTRAPTTGRRTAEPSDAETVRPTSPSPPPELDELSEKESYEDPEESYESETPEQKAERLEELARLHTIKSTLSGMSVGHNYAVLPHGVRLEGWTDEEKEELNDHVRHLLHSRRAAFKRSMRAFGKYVSKPLGFFVTLYAFIITFWGAAWVIFLIGWIHAGNRQKYFVEICDQILTAMLVVIGIGLSPWRAVDTYHMIFIARYSYKEWRLRRERGLPELRDHNDLPETDPKQLGLADPPTNHPANINQEESAIDSATQPYNPTTHHDPFVLTPTETKKLKHHQDKFAKSHTFYKPHETSTHRAFSIRLLITVVVLLDFHSMFQMALGGTTWGIYYRVRPKALTTVLLACSISCNIMSGVIISIGDRRSRKKEVFEQMTRQARTEEAMRRIEKRDGRPRLGLRKSIDDLASSKQQSEAKKTLDRSAQDDVQRIATTTAAL